MSNENGLFMRWTLDNKEATEFLEHLFQLSQEVDDLEDKDGGPTTAVNATVRAMMVLPTLAWYKKHLLWYQPVLLSSLLFWEASNEWAQSPRRDDRMFAFVYREVLEQVVTVTAYLCGGIDHARLVLREVHERYRQDESFEEWEQDNERRRHRATAVSGAPARHH